MQKNTEKYTQIASVNRSTLVALRLGYTLDLVTVLLPHLKRV